MRTLVDFVEDFISTDLFSFLQDTTSIENTDGLLGLLVTGECDTNRVRAIINADAPLFVVIAPSRHLIDVKVIIYSKSASLTLSRPHHELLGDAFKLFIQVRNENSVDLERIYDALLHIRVLVHELAHVFNRICVFTHFHNEAGAVMRVVGRSHYFHIVI